MKSLEKAPVENFDIVPEHLRERVKKDGFEVANIDFAYCLEDKDFPWESRCLKRAIYAGAYDIFIYILSFGIGVDIDWDCGGNSTYALFLFKDYSFEEAYNKMVDYVEEYR